LCYVAQNKRLRSSTAEVGGRLAAAADSAAAVNERQAADKAALKSLEKRVAAQQSELVRLRTERDERAEAFSRLQTAKLEEVGGLLDAHDDDSPAIQHLQAVLARLSRELEENTELFYAEKEEKEANIDRRLVTRLFVSYVTKSKSKEGKEQAKCEEILGVIAKMMGWDDADRIRVGLRHTNNAGSDAETGGGGRKRTGSKSREAKETKESLARRVLSPKAKDKRGIFDAKPAARAEAAAAVVEAPVVRRKPKRVGSIYDKPAAGRDKDDKGDKGDCSYSNPMMD